jgi:ribose 5-phosphate isomerase
MTGCPLRGFYGTYKPRSRVGLGKGSHSTSQRLVEALAEPCAKTKRTYGLCTSKGTAHVQGVAGRQRLQLAERRGTLAPRPLTVAVGDVAQFFLSFS